MADASYEPIQMAELMDGLAQLSRQRTIEFFSSHPHPENRRRYIEAEVATIQPRADMINSEDFDEMKARLAQF